MNPEKKDKQSGDAIRDARTGRFAPKPSPSGSLSPLNTHFGSIPPTDSLRPTVLGFGAANTTKISAGTDPSRPVLIASSPLISMIEDPAPKAKDKSKDLAPAPIHQSALISGLRRARAKVSLSQLDCIEEIEAGLDPTLSDPDLCKQFISTANQTLPNTVELLLAQLTKSGGLVKPLVEWMKKKVRTSTGLNLQDDIHNFMQLFQNNTRCSDMLAFIATIHYTALERKAASDKEDTAKSRMVGLRSVSFMKHVLHTDQDDLRAALLQLEKGQEPEFCNLRGTSKITAHQTPGWSLFFPAENQFCDAETLISIMLAYIGYVAPVKITDADPSKLLDDYLINGRFDHSRKMNGKVTVQDWLTEDDKLLADLESACIAADMEYIIPTDQQIQINYQTAASDSLWTAVMRQLEHESIQAGHSVLIKHKSLAEIRCLLCRAQETIDTKQANNQGRISKPKASNPKDGKTDTKTTTKTSSKKKGEEKSSGDAKQEKYEKRDVSTMSKQDLASRTEARKSIDCQYWKEGTCRNEKDCQFKHDPALKNTQEKQVKKTTNEASAELSEDDGEEFSLAFTQPLKDAADSNGSITWDTRVVSNDNKTVSVVHSQDSGDSDWLNNNRFQALSSSDDQPDDHIEWIARMQSKGNRHGSGKEVTGLVAGGAEILHSKCERAAKNKKPKDWKQPHWMPDNTKQVLTMDVGNELQHVIRSDSDLEHDNSIDLGSGSDEEAQISNLQDAQQSITSFFKKVSPEVVQSNLQSVYYSSNITVTASQAEQDITDSDDEDLIMPSTNSDFYESCQCQVEDHDHCNICGQCQGEYGCCNCDDIQIQYLPSITPAQHFR